MSINIKYLVFLVMLVYYIFSVLFMIILYRKISKGNTTLSDNVKSAIEETLEVAKSLGINNLSDLFSLIDRFKKQDNSDTSISDTIAEQLNKKE